MNFILSNGWSFLAGLAAGIIASGFFAFYWALWVIQEVKRGRWR